MIGWNEEIKKEPVKPIAESIQVNTEDEFKNNITSQLNAILESAKSEIEDKEDKKKKVEKKLQM